MIAGSASISCTASAAAALIARKGASEEAEPSNSALGPLVAFTAIAMVPVAPPTIGTARTCALDTVSVNTLDAPGLTVAPARESSALTKATVAPVQSRKLPTTVPTPTVPTSISAADAWPALMSSGGVPRSSGTWEEVSDGGSGT